MPIQVQEASRTPNKHDQSQTSPEHFIIKRTSTNKRKRKLKPIREHNQIIYKGKPMKKEKILSTENL
jgi:hypothetical protein